MKIHEVDYDEQKKGILLTGHPYNGRYGRFALWVVYGKLW